MSHTCHPPGTAGLLMVCETIFALPVWAERDELNSCRRMQGGVGMRREAGAVIVLFILLLIKLPGIVGDYRWLAAKSMREDSLKTPFVSRDHPPLPSTSPLHGSDSSHKGALSTHPAAGGGSTQTSPTPPLPGSSRTVSSRKTRFNVPQAYLDNPLAFLSSAPPESLVILPGIGPVIAERIANTAGGKGPFTRWDDLLSVKGIGPKKLEKLKQIANAP